MTLLLASSVYTTACRSSQAIANPKRGVCCRMGVLLSLRLWYIRRMYTNNTALLRTDIILCSWENQPSVAFPKIPLAPNIVKQHGKTAVILTGDPSEPFSQTRANFPPEAATRFYTVLASQESALRILYTTTIQCTIIYLCGTMDVNSLSRAVQWQIYKQVTIKVQRVLLHPLDFAFVGVALMV